jgi:integrase
MPKKPSKLPKGVQRHGPSYRIWFVYQGGRVFELAGTDLREAERLRKQRVREVAEGKYLPQRFKGTPTIATYYAHWIALRRSEGVVRSVEDEARWIERHALPVLGSVRIDELRAVDVRNWVMGLRAKGDLAAKSIHNCVGSLSTMLEAARFEELIGANPAHRLPKGTLPAVSKRTKPPFTRAQAETLITDERIEVERRVLYSMLCLAGFRLGEACGRRWRDIDTAAQPLQCLTVASQYDDRPLKTAKGEDDAARHVPVHGELARVLAEWKLSGFAAAFGRHPKLEDFIVPDPRTMGPRTKNQAVKALYRDCDLVGVPRQGTHAGRRFFISHARMDGARADVLERVTHNAAGEQIDQYTYFGWEALCEAVACLRVDLRRGRVVALPKVAAAGSSEYAEGASADAPCATECATDAETPSETEENGWRRRDSKTGPMRNPGEIVGKGQRRGRSEPPQIPAVSVNVPQDVPPGTVEALRRAVEILRAGGHHDEADAVTCAVAAVQGVRA